MNRAVKNSMIFIAGAGVGTLVTAIVLREKYERDLSAETESLINDFIDHRNKQTVSVDIPQELRTKGPTYDSIVSAFGYSQEDGEYDPAEDYGDDENTQLGTDSNIAIIDDLPDISILANSPEPHSVSPDEFNEIMEIGYDYIQWNIYNGKHEAQVICDEQDLLVEYDEMDKTIGKAIYAVGEYDDDVVYVRNDRLRLAVEVTRDNRSYSEILEAMPYLEI